MNGLASFAASFLLGALDLAVMAIAVKKLTSKPSSTQSILLAGVLIFKGALLAAGLFLLGRQEWVERKMLMAGVLAPFALFVVWQGIALQMKHGRRAQS